MSELLHYRCPLCDEEGERITAQDGETLACRNDACRVFTFSEYVA
jgi:hypothetical protein